MKHTPGPWHYQKGADTRIGPQAIVRARGASVCEVFAQRGITEANARLIAAAPDMLALLQGVLIEWREAIADDDYAVDGGDAVEWLLSDFVPAVQAIVKRAASDQ